MSDKCSKRLQAGAVSTRRAASGFTLIELLVVIAIIAILAAILFPVFARARENAKRSACTSNYKQLGIGMQMYVQDYDGYFPEFFQGGWANFQAGNWPAGAKIAPAPYNVFTASTPAERFVIDNGTGGTGGVHIYTWQDSIYPYLKNMQIFSCPSQTRPAQMDPTSCAAYGGTWCAPIGDWWWAPSVSTNSLIIRGGNVGWGPAVNESTINGVSQKILMLHENGVYANREPSYWFSQSQGANYNKEQWVHNDGQVIGFADGHCKWIPRSSTPQYSCNGGGATCKYWGPTVAVD